jgi:hypothetical protein
VVVVQVVQVVCFDDIIMVEIRMNQIDIDDSS